QIRTLRNQLKSHPQATSFGWGQKIVGVTANSKYLDLAHQNVDVGNLLAGFDRDAAGAGGIWSAGIIDTNICGIWTAEVTGSLEDKHVAIHLAGPKGSG